MTELGDFVFFWHRRRAIGEQRAGAGLAGLPMEQLRTALSHVKNGWVKINLATRTKSATYQKKSLSETQSVLTGNVQNPTQRLQKTNKRFNPN